MKKIALVLTLLPLNAFAGIFENDEGELHWWMIPLIIVIVIIVIFINGRADTRKGLLGELGFEPDEPTIEKWRKRDELHDAEKVIAEAKRRLKNNYTPKEFAHQYEEIEYLISIIDDYDFEKPWTSLSEHKGARLAIQILLDKYESLKNQNK